MLDKGKAIEVHDHRDGECDLPDLDEWVKTPMASRTRCYWDLCLRELYEHHTCGCWMCTERPFRKQQRRKERHTRSRAIRRELDELDD